MPRTPADLHVDAMLTNIGISYRQERTEFIADRVFPLVPVQKQSDKYRVYPREWWLRTYADKRAPATESKGITFEYSEDAYFAEKYSVHSDVPEEEVVNQDDDLDVFQDATEITVEHILLKREIDFINNFLATGQWGKDVDVATSSTAWSSSSTATPLQDVRSERLHVKRLTGRWPNRIVAAPQTFEDLRHTDQILDRVIYGGNIDRPADVTPALLASLFDVQEFLIAGAVQYTGDQTKDEATDQELDDNTEFMFSDGLLLVYAADRPSPRQPSGGYTFAWTGASGTRDGMRTKRFELPRHDAERVETDDFRDLKLVGAPLGVFFHNTSA